MDSAHADRLARRRAYMAEYRTRPEYKAGVARYKTTSAHKEQAAYHKTAEYKERRRAYYSSPEYKQKRAEYRATQKSKQQERAFWQSPECKAKKLVYRGTPEYMAHRKQYLSTTEAKLRRQRNYLRKAYGITLEYFFEMRERQKGLCAICGDVLPSWGIKCHVDHDHTTGKVRGLLCHGCNVGLGKFHDNSSLMRKAADYLDLQDVRSAQPGDSRYTVTDAAIVTAGG